MADGELNGVYALDGVITVVDALLGLNTLEQHETSRRQAALADRIVLTKSDLQGARPDAVAQRVGEVNSGARLLQAVRGDISPTLLFTGGSYGLSGKSADVSDWLAHEMHAHTHAHESDIASVSIVRDEPLHAVTLALLLCALAENCGADLLRMKGIVNVAEDPQRPAVIHGVQHVYHAPAWLPRWPSADRRTRLVLIGRKLRASWVRALIELLEQEVTRESARHG